MVELHLDRLPRTVRLVRSPLPGGDAGRVAPSDGAAPDAVASGLRPEAFLPQLVLLDQAKLPYEESVIVTSDWREAVDAVKRLKVRGAPAIGDAGAAAVALAAAELALACDASDASGSGDAFCQGTCAEAADAASGTVHAWRAAARDRVGGPVRSAAQFWELLARAAEAIAQARPTAVNLAWAVRGAMDAARAAEAGSAWAVVDALFRFAEGLLVQDEACNRAIGENGAALLVPGSRVLTHCNAGSLATAFYGTALGVVYAAAAQGKIERVFADETRPVGQGARLTSWELARAGVPVTLLCDNMAASVMGAGMVDAVIVGADRIAANGDVANKIGTYGVAVLARHHGIPFYVAAPSSTIDFSLPAGAGIPIEQRDPVEVLPRPIDGVDVLNPAFDVTPAELVSAIVTEKGVFAPADLAAAYGVH